MAPLIAPSITRELIAAELHTEGPQEFSIGRDKSRIARESHVIVDGTVSSSIFVIRHLPSPFRFSPSARLTVTFDHVSKPCRFNKGTDIGDDVIPDVHGSPLERAYLHFPPLSFHYDVGNEDVFERAIKPRSARFLETMAGSTRSGRLEQDKISGHILGEILPKFGHRARYCSMHKLRNGGSWHASFAKTLCDNHGVWYVDVNLEKTRKEFICIIIILSLNDNQRQYISPYIFL